MDVRCLQSEQMKRAKAHDRHCDARKLFVGRLDAQSDVPVLLLPRDKQPEGHINNAFSAYPFIYTHDLDIRKPVHSTKQDFNRHRTMASSNPSNFANMPKDKLSEIAAKGGHASHGGGGAHQDVRTILSPGS